MKAGIFTVTITDVKDIGIQDTRHFRLSFDPGTIFDFDAGQFLNVIIPETPEHKGFKRPYSIASPPIWKGFVDLAWKKVPGGPATSYLWTLQKGDKLQIQGPLGRFSPKQPYAKKIVFVSTGTGIAPFRSMIHVLLDQKIDSEIWNLFGNRFEEDILYREEFEELEAKHKNFRNIFTVSRPKEWKGETMYVQHLFKKHFLSPLDTQIYICGLSPMIKEVSQVAMDLGCTKDQIYYEKYD